MKRIYYVAASLMAIMTTGCSESSDAVEEQIVEEVVEHVAVPMSISASVAETRLDYERSADNRTVTVTWNDTDNLQVFNASDNDSYVDFTMKSHDGQSAVFETADSDPLNVNIGDDITAIYPYRVNSGSGNGVKVVSMQDQTIQADGNGDASMDVMVAHSTWQGDNTSLQFSHLMGSIILQLNFDEATTVEHIILTADGGFNNYATIEMTADGGTSLGDFKQGPMSASTTNATASTQYTGQIFFIPGTYTNIVVTAITDKGHYTCTKAVSNLTLEQGMNYRLQVLASAWDVAPLYAWGPADKYATNPGFTAMTSATDNDALYFLGNKDNFVNCVWSGADDNMKFTLTNQSSDWSVFMPNGNTFTFYPEYLTSYFPSWGGQNVLRVNVVSGEVKTGWRRNIYYVGNSNGWDGNSANASNYLLTCDIDNTNHIDEFTIRGLVFNDQDEIKFPVDDYDNVWHGEFIKAQYANQPISDGAVHNYDINYTNGDVVPYTDLKFKVNSSGDAGTYDITINVIDQTITFTKQ